VFPLLLFLLLLELLASEGARDTVIVGINEEARVVLEADGQVGTEAGHFEEVDTGFAHDFLNQDVVKFVFLNRVALLVELVLEDVEGEAASLGKDLFDDELVLFVGVRKVDDLVASIVDVRDVVVLIGDFLLGGDELADVDSRGVCVLLQVVRQILKVVTQVVSLDNRVQEGILVVANDVVLLLALSLLSVQHQSLVSVLSHLLLNDCQLLGAVFGGTFYLRVVHEPLGQEVNWVLWAVLVHHGHSLGNNSAQVGALEVFGVCYLIDHFLFCLKASGSYQV